MLASDLKYDLAVSWRVRFDTLKVGEERRIEAKDPYYEKLSRGWSEALRHAFEHVDEYDDGLVDSA